MNTDTPDSALDHWYTEPWTKWRIFEFWARSSVGALWAGSILVLSMGVSRDFAFFALYAALGVLAIQSCVPNWGATDV